MALISDAPTLLVMKIMACEKSRNFRMKGVPSYGLTPMVVDAATLATMHSDAERVPISEFLKGVRIYFDVLRSNF